MGSITFDVRKMRTETLVVTIVGDAALVMHSFGEKVQREIEERQSGKLKDKKRPPRNPVEEYLCSFYRDDDGDPCVPAVCFKNCIITAAQRFYDVTKVSLRGSLRVLGDSMKLNYRSLEMDRSPVRLAGPSRTADLRYRPMFHGWWFRVTFEYDADAINADTIMAFIHRAGFSVGLFEWRADKGGEWGSFHAATEAEAKRLKPGRPKEDLAVETAALMTNSEYEWLPAKTEVGKETKKQKAVA